MKLQVLVKLSLVFTLVVIMLGAYTRLADAGLGCPDWPGCYGQLTVPTDSKDVLQAELLYPELTVEADKAWAEMVHRYFAGTLGLLVMGIAFICIREQKAPTAFAVGLVVLIVFQALLGMWTVTLKLMPVVVMGHLLGGFMLLSCLFILHWRLSESHSSAPPSVQTNRPMALLSMATLLVVLGQILLGGWTSSNYAALMCSSLPICEGDWINQLDMANAFTMIQSGHDSYEFGVLDYQARMTIHVAHRIGAIITTFIVALLALRCWLSGQARLRTASRNLLIVLLLQLALGISNVLFSLPIAVAVAHNLGAAILLVTVLHANYVLWQPSRVMALNKENVS